MNGDRLGRSVCRELIVEVKRRQHRHRIRVILVTMVKVSAEQGRDLRATDYLTDYHRVQC